MRTEEVLMKLKMSLLIKKHDELLKKYNKIWVCVSTQISNGEKIWKEGSKCICLSECF